MIPKVIHYCWFGGNPKSELIENCIKSWEKYAPDFEIIEWNESNFNVNKYLYSQQAYESKKYAFVSDVARFDILYSQGGIYLDTDVELIKPIDEFLDNRLFMGYDQKDLVASGLIMGAQKGHPLLQKIISFYQNNSFLLSNGRPNTTTVVTIVSDVLLENGIKLDGALINSDELSLYPWDFFDPYDYENNLMKKTNNTVSIHHYAATWKSKKDNCIYFVGRLIKKIVGKKLYDKIARFKHAKFG